MCEHRIKYRLDTEIVIQRAIERHGDKYDYSKVQYINKRTKVKIICSIHGEFEQLPLDHVGGSGCAICGIDISANKQRKIDKEYIKEYKSYRSMLGRCYSSNENAVTWPYYQGKGIIVCDRWRTDGVGQGFLNFLEDMGRKPTAMYTIDRIDSDDNYTPENCRWATYSQQAINRKNKRNKSGTAGITWSKKSNKWKVELERNNKSYYGGLYNSIEEAEQEMIKLKEKIKDIV